LVRIRCTAAILVAYIERWADRHVCHNYSSRMFLKTISNLLGVCMHDKIA
jgi:hypothetical protein